MDDFHEATIRMKMENAMQAVSRIIEANKTLVPAGDVHHQYQDKFFLSEFLTNQAAASQINCLTLLGLGSETLKQLMSWGKTSAVSLSFKGSENVKFISEETSDVESKTKHVTEVAQSSGETTTLTSTVVTSVTEYTWRVEMKYELSAVKGVSEEIVLKAHSSSVDVKTTKKRKQDDLANSYGPMMCNVSWLVKHLSEDLSPCFHIDREHADCHTPVRNPDIKAALDYFQCFRTWAFNVTNTFLKMLRNGFIHDVKPDEQGAMDMMLAKHDFFVPVLPLFRSEDAITHSEDSAQKQSAILASFADGSIPEGSMLISIGDANRFLAEEMRTLRERHDQLREQWPPSQKSLTNSDDAVLILTLGHLNDVVGQHENGVMYVESLLRKQLIAAIGKEITPKEFAEYMVFHNRKVFDQQYLPLPFCYSVRRSERHSPEGHVSIEQINGMEMSQPIYSIAAYNANSWPMTFPLSASSTATFCGNHHLHAVLQHEFSDSHEALQLVARARQFSSFLVLVGQISSPTSFSPKYGAIIQNKDELKIPLELLTLPTPKEFKDAIESLSPEQQAFAKAFRAMQLESTLFGVMIIQIKPQLEKVLNLPEDSLTKEIKLTQDLMQLFIKYQIPSDLLSFETSDAGAGTELVGATAVERLAAVKEHVNSMHDMIEQSKNEELEARKQEARYQEPFFDRDDRSRGACKKGGPVSNRLVERIPQCARRAAAAAPPPPGAAAPPAAPPAPAPPAPAAVEAAVPTEGGAPPQPNQFQQSPPQNQGSQPTSSSMAGASSGPCAAQRDYTSVPQEMDQQFKELDSDNALRATRIKAGDVWSKKFQKSLLAQQENTYLYASNQETERNAAFDLLEALTKSGGLPIHKGSLHIIVAATHCFDKTITECVVQDNMNPVERVERSMLIMATTVHRQPASSLICGSQRERVKTSSPMLFINNSEVVEGTG